MFTAKSRSQRVLYLRKGLMNIMLQIGPSNLQNSNVYIYGMCESKMQMMIFAGGINGPFLSLLHWVSGVF